MPGQRLASLGRGGPNRNLHLPALGPSWGLQLLFVLAAPVVTELDILPPSEPVVSTPHRSCFWSR